MNGMTLSPLKTSLRGVYEQAQENMDEMKKRFADVKMAAKFTGGSMIAQTAQFIRANPGKSVAASFIGGYLLMRLLRW